MTATLAGKFMEFMMGNMVAAAVAWMARPMR